MVFSNALQVFHGCIKRVRSFNSIKLKPDIKKKNGGRIEAYHNVMFYLDGARKTLFLFIPLLTCQSRNKIVAQGV